MCAYSVFKPLEAPARSYSWSGTGFVPEELPCFLPAEIKQAAQVTPLTYLVEEREEETGFSIVFARLC